MAQKAPDAPAASALPSDAPAPLEQNVALLDAAEVAMACKLIECGQGRLFESWKPPGEDDDAKHHFFDQIAALDDAYPHGLAQYALMQNSANGGALDGWSTTLPVEGPYLKGYPAHVTTLMPGSPEFDRAERAGLEAAVGLGVVVSAGATTGAAAGAAGRRTPLDLPCELCSGITVLGHYCAHVAALQTVLMERLGRTVVLPVLIITCAATHEATMELLSSCHHYGLAPSQVTCLAQGKVAVVDGSGVLAQATPYTIVTADRGDGDIHALMRTRGLGRKWARMGVHWLLMLQEPDPLHMSHYMASLGSAVLQVCAITKRPKSHSFTTLH